jgi:hypothetical protein
MPRGAELTRVSAFVFIVADVSLHSLLSFDGAIEETVLSILEFENGMEMEGYVTAFHTWKLLTTDPESANNTA